MKKSLIGILLGAGLVFVWGNFSWMVLPFHKNSLNQLSNETEISAAIEAGGDKPGIYILPHSEEWDIEATKKGPFMFAMIRSGADDTISMRQMMLRSLFNSVFCAILIGIMLSAAAPRLNYIGRVMFVASGGLFAGLAAAYPNCIWWEFPAAYVGLTIADLVVGWGLAGLVMAGFINGKE